MKHLVFLLTMLVTLSASGQNYYSNSQRSKTEKLFKLTDKQKNDLKRAAESKVMRFQENCALIAGDASYQDKTCNGGYVDVAMQDFLKDAKIEITSLDGKTSSRKPVRRYLLNLALLRKNRYRSINITSYNCAMVSNFVKDVNMSNRTGQEWYVGEVTVYQQFNAVTKEGRTVHDTVKRTMKVYALRNQIYSNDGVEEWWDIKLDDITARNI